MKKHPIEMRPVIFDSRQVELLQQGKLSAFIQIAKPRQYPSLLARGWTDDYIIDEDNVDWLTLDCPFGKAGHKLFVREKFALVQRKDFFDDEWTKPIVAYSFFGVDEIRQVHYASVSGIKTTEQIGSGNFKVFKDRWLSPVCMSKVNSRHLLDIKAITLGRLNTLSLQEISMIGFQQRGDASLEVTQDAAQDWLSDYWIDKYGLESLKSNPLVWFVHFKEIDRVV